MTLEWRRSSYCDTSACVDVAFVDGEHSGVLIRNSRIAPAISATREEWEAFVAGVKAGEFDWPEAAVD